MKTKSIAEQIKLKIVPLALIASGLALAGASAFLLLPTFQSPVKKAPPKTKTVEILNREFVLKATEFLNLPATDQTAKLTDLRQVALDRKSAMALLLIDDPRKFAELSVETGQWQNLPAEITNLLEQKTNISGRLTLAIYDNADATRSTTTYTLNQTDGQTINLHFLDSVPTRSVQDFTATAIRLDHDALVSSETGSSFEKLDVAENLGQFKVAVILFKFLNSSPNDPTRPTLDQARNVVFNNPDSVNEFLKENSHNQVSLTGSLRPDGDVFGEYTINYNSIDACNTDNFTADAKTQAMADGFIEADYDYLIFRIPSSTVCGVGWAAVTTNGYSIMKSGFYPFIVSHEFGHLFGARHSGNLNCYEGATRVSMSGNCSNTEFSDPFDVMNGYLTYFHHFSTVWKHDFGYYTADSMIDVTAFGEHGPGQYTLIPQQQPGSGTKVIRVPIKSPAAGRGDYLYLEYRQPYGTLWDNFPTNDPVVNGVSVRNGGYGPQSATGLVDTTAGTTDFQDAPLVAGQEFYDPIRGIRIRTVSVSPTGAVIEISFTCTPSLPTLTLGWPYSCSYLLPKPPGTAQSCTLAIQNNDQLGCPARTFTMTPLLPASPVGWTQTPSPLTVQLQAGEKQAQTLTITAPHMTSDGAYSITQSLVHPSFPATPVTSTMTFNVEGTPPVVSITSPNNNDRMETGSTISFSAQATDNNTLLSAALYVDGILLKQCQFVQALSGSCSADWTTTGTQAGLHQLRATAVDGAGNSAEQTIAVNLYTSGGGGIDPIETQ